MREAVDVGINFFDNAWSYSDGLRKECMGLPADGYRQRVFLMTKKASRAAALAIARFKESSRRLRTYAMEYRADVGECPRTIILTLSRADFVRRGREDDRRHGDKDADGHAWNHSRNRCGHGL